MTPLQCGCGDPYCRFCGDPTLAEREKATEEIAEQLLDTDLSAEEMKYAVELGLIIVRGMKFFSEK